MIRRGPAVDPAWDPLTYPSGESVDWTTVNVGEAIPGVQTPLNWTFFSDAAELAARVPAHMIGVRPRSESVLPTRPEDRETRLFYGRAAIQCGVVGMLGDRMPGTSGPEAVRSVLGEVPPGMRFAPTRRYYPQVALKLPRTFVSVPRRLPEHVAEYDAWRRDRLARVDDLDATELAALVREARDRLTSGIVFQTVLLFAVVQPLYDALERLVARAGTGDVAVLSGTGGAELAVVRDIWDASRGRRSLETVVADHGFHGPHEGVISSRVWREDDTPLRAMVERYARLPDSEDPRAGEERAAAELARQQAEVLAALPRAARPPARALLTLAARRITLRGYPKRSFLGALDVGRAASRRLGVLLTEADVLAEPGDVDALTLDELTLGVPENATELVEVRRARIKEYESLVLPRLWRGTPPTRPAGAGEPLAVGDVLTGTGVSAGVVEGVVKVVLDPAQAEADEDTVLVAPFTDPGWSALMFVSAALVVDIGGALSHAAVVARELRVPCVVNTGSGTTRLVTGDRVRVDGSAGTVELLEHGVAPGT